MSALQAAAERIRVWRADALQYVRDVFQVEPDQWQADVLRAWSSTDPRDRRISMQSCAGPGKSCVEAWCAWQFLTCFSDGVNHPNGLATSMSGDNLADGLWKELAKWYERSPMLVRAFEFTKTRIFAREFPETWWLSARTWPKTADTEALGRVLSGLHADYIAYFLDESGSSPPALGRAAEQGLGNCVWGKILQGGNPASHDSLLYESATTQATMWRAFSVTADPADPRRTPRVDPTWARQQIDLYGRDNSWVKAFILGEFPAHSINTLLGPDEVEAAFKRAPREDEYAWSQKRLGIDVARFGDDRTVIFPRQGLLAHEPIVMRVADTNQIAGRVALTKRNFASECDLIDDTGHWGHGVIDNLRAAGYTPIGVQFHAPANDPRYANRRSEGWLEMADWVKRGGSLANALPVKEALKRELTTITYTFSGGKWALEPKDLVKKRLGVSPDLADALALTFMLPEMPTMAGMGGMLPGAFRHPAGGGQTLHDYDPLERAFRGAA